MCSEETSKQTERPVVNLTKSQPQRECGEEEMCLECVKYPEGGS